MTREEALNTVRNIYQTDKEKEALEILIPQLAESEDERIWEALYDFISDTLEDYLSDYGISKGEALAYLEKQKEYVSNNFDDVWDEEDCEEIIAEGQKLTPRFKELLKEVCHAWYDRGVKLEKQKPELSVVGDLQAKTPQKSIELVEWKEAAKIREWILAKMQELAATGVPCSDEIKMADKAIDYLIKQKEYIEEPKIAFGDWGDNEKKEAIITCLKYMRFIKKITNQEYDDLIKWLDNKTVSNVSENGECLREVKQKEQNSVDEQFPPLDGLDAIKAKYYDDGFKNGFDEGVASVKPSEWSEEDKQNLSVCLTYIKDTQLRDWLVEAFHIKYDKSAEWSEEDERCWNLIWDILDGPFIASESGYKKARDWFIENCPKGYKHSQSSWKPSEEQMEALLGAKGVLLNLQYNDWAKILEELYEQLKQL